jgi:hypothetical protein
MRSLFTSRLFTCLALLILLIGAAIALLPTVASTGWGRRQVTKWLNRNIPGEIEIRDLKLAWGEGQTIEGFLLKDENGVPVITFEKLSSQASLWNLIKKSTHLGHIELLDLNATITTNANGISNLQHSLGINKPNALLSPSTILLKEVHLEANLFAEGKPLSLHLSGKTNKDLIAGHFDIKTILPNLKSEDWSSLTEEAQRLLHVDGLKQMTLDAAVQNFPVSLLDSFAGLYRPELSGCLHAFLGDNLSLNLMSEPTPEGLGLALKIMAPFFEGSLKSKIVGEQLVIEQPTTFQFTPNPESINSFLQERLQILNSGALYLKIEELTLPFSLFEGMAPTDRCMLSLRANAQMPEGMKIDLPSVGVTEISNLKADIYSTACSETIEIRVNGEANQRGDPFEFSFNSLMNKPVHLTDRIADLTSTLNISHFPLRGIPFFHDQNKDIQQLFGSYADLNLGIKRTDRNQWDLHCSGQTEHLTMKSAEFIVGKGIRLAAPLKLILQLHPESTKPYLSKNNLSLDESTTAEIVLSHLTVPDENKKKAQIKAELRLNTCRLSHLQSSDAVQLSATLLRLDGEVPEALNTELSGQFTFPNPTTIYPTILGRQGSFSISSQVSVDSNDQITLSNLKTYLESDKGTLNLEGQILPSQQLILTHPLQIHYAASPETFKLLIKGQDYFQIDNNPMVHFRAEPFQCNLSDLKLNALTVKGFISINSLALKNGSGVTPVLSDIQIPWEINSPLNMVRVNIKTWASTEGYTKPSEVTAQFLISNWLKNEMFDPESLKVEALSNFTGLPTSLLSSFILQEDLTPLLGPTLDLELKTLIDKDQSQPGYWDMVLDGSNLHVKARLKFGEAITLYESTGEAARFRWTLSKEGFYYLNKLFGISPIQSILAFPITLKGILSDLYLPLKDSSSILDGGRINIDVETSDIRWTDASRPVYKLKGQLNSLDLIDHIDLDLQSSSIEGSSFSLTGKIMKAFNKEGKPDLGLAKIDLDFKTTQLPISILQLFSLDESHQKAIRALTGNEIDSRISLQFDQMNGPIFLWLKGSNGEMILDGTLKAGVFLLNKPFEWHLKVTPELGETILKDHFALFSGAVASQEPIKITIDPVGFSLPVIPLDLAQLKIQKGILALNKVQFRNEGELKDILSLLKPIQTDRFVIWFTPLYFNLQQEKLTLHRFDLQIAQIYSLALWGEINLKSNKLDLTLGLSEQALRHAFNISFLDPDYMLQIPLKGRKGKIEIDKKKAVARISALVAQTDRSVHGKIIGTALDFIAGGGGDGKPPEPTTQPLPWEPNEEKKANPSNQGPNNSQPVENENQTPEKVKKDKSSKKKSDGFTIDLQKGASSLLDFLQSK